MSTPYDAALRQEYRLQYVEETTAGSAPSNPTWNRFSDNIRSFEPTPDAGGESQFGLGSPDSQGAFRGSNADAITVAYDLQQKSASGETLVTSGGSANDAFGDLAERTSDNTVNNTHTIVRRIKQASLDAGNTVDGGSSKDTRQYVVALGAYPSEGSLTGDPTSPQPILAEVTYECERVDTYQIDQPDSGTTLEVSSSSANDTTQTLTIEDEDAGTTEDFNLNGTSTVSGAQSFSDIDAAHLDGETEGDITVTDGTDDLLVIQGQNSQDHGEGQLGVPALGSGSNSSSIGQGYELYHDDAVERPNGTDIADGFESTEFAINNNIDGTEQGGTPRRALSAGNQGATAEVVVFGETEYHDYTVDMITTDTDNFRWTLDGGHAQLDSADVRGVDPDPDDVGQGKRMTTLTLHGQGVTLSD